MPHLEGALDILNQTVHWQSLLTALYCHLPMANSWHCHDLGALVLSQPLLSILKQSHWSLIFTLISAIWFDCNSCKLDDWKVSVHKPKAEELRLNSKQSQKKTDKRVYIFGSHLALRLFSVWESWWLFKWADCLNIFTQSIQPKGFCPAWVR